MEEIIDVRELLKAIKNKLWMIILLGAIFGVISGIVSTYLITPQYEATTTLIVNKKNSDEETQLANSDDINYVQRLAYTYSEIITSRAVLGKVIDKLNLDVSYESLKSSVDLTNVQNTQIIEVSVEYPDPQIAKDICNTIPTAFDAEVQRIMKVSGVEVIDPAIRNNKPIKPRKKQNVILAAMIGALIGIFIAVIQELADTKIKTASDIKQKLEIPVLGVIPKQ